MTLTQSAATRSAGSLVVRPPSQLGRGPSRGASRRNSLSDADEFDIPTRPSSRTAQALRNSSQMGALGELRLGSKQGSRRSSKYGADGGFDADPLFRQSSKDSFFRQSTTDSETATILEHRPFGGNGPRNTTKGSFFQADNKDYKLPLGLNMQMSLGVKKLCTSLNLPFDETLRAVQVFARFTDVPAGGDVKAAEMFRAQFLECLNYMLQVRGASVQVTDDMCRRCFKICDRDGSGSIDVEEFCLWYAAESFSMEMMLDEDQQQVRRFAIKHSIPILDIDRYKTYFDKFDLDGSGEIDYSEFCQLITILWKIPKGLEIPESRLKTFWKMADLDGSGLLEFEEFVLFYRKYCESSCDDDPITAFYRDVRRV